MSGKAVRWLTVAGVFALAAAILWPATSRAATGINQQISFEGKVVLANGTNVPDGTYNIEFKIYQDGNNQGTGSTLSWTEDHLVSASQGVTVTSGTFQVNLGAITALSSVNFNSDTLWLSINIGGTASTPSWDGEMKPYIRFTSVPYAMNALQLGGVQASGFGQLANSQTWTGVNVFSATGGNALTLSGAPLNSATASLLGLGSAIVGGNTATNGGTYLGLNEPSSGAGSAADFLNFQNGGTSKFQITSTGALNLSGAITGPTATNTINGLIINSGALSGITTYSGSNTLTLTGTGANELAITGAPVNTATLSLVRLGNAIASGNTATNGGTYLGLNAPSSGAGSAADFINFQANGVYKLKVSSAGLLDAVGGYAVNGTAGTTVSCTNGNYLNTMVVNKGIVTGGACASTGLSDQRVKTNIVSLDNSVLDTIRNVNAVTFNYDCTNSYFTDTQTYCDPTDQAGVIAQQLAKIYPNLVTQDSFGYYHVNYQGLSAYTLKAVTEVAQFLDSSGNATLSNVSGNTIHVTGSSALDNGATISGTTIVQNPNGMALLTADIASNKVQIGSATIDGTQTNLQLDSSNTFGDQGGCSASSNQGAIYYNTATASMRGCINGNWEDMVSTGGLGLLAFGVIPDSSNAGSIGDLAGITPSNSPCKVYWSGAQQVSVAPCYAYSGGRKVTVSATTLSTSGLGASMFANICLNGGTPTLLAGSATETAAAMPAWSANNPVLCLATIKTAAAGTVGNIYDTRTFTTTQKSFATSNTAVSNGFLVTQSGTANQVTATATDTAANIRGVVVAYSGSTSSTAANVILAVGGPQWVKAVGTSTVNQVVVTALTSGYSATAGPSPLATPYSYAGVATRTIDTACTSAANCQYSQFLNPIDIR